MRTIAQPVIAAGTKTLYLFLGAMVIINIVLLAFLTISALQKPKIAFVRSGKILEQYVGLKEARKVFEQKARVWQANVDTLEAEFSGSLSEFNRSSEKSNSAERLEQKAYLQKQEQNLEQYRQAVLMKSRKEEEQMVEGVLNQINSCVEEFGKSEGYEVILGTTSAGNLLYGHQAIDITDQVLQELNRTYKYGQHSTN